MIFTIGTIGTILLGMSVGGGCGFIQGLHEKQREDDLKSESLSDWLKYGDYKKYRKGY